MIISIHDSPIIYPDVSNDIILCDDFNVTIHHDSDDSISSSEPNQQPSPNLINSICALFNHFLILIKNKIPLFSSSILDFIKSPLFRKIMFFLIFPLLIAVLTAINFASDIDFNNTSKYRFKITFLIIGSIFAFFTIIYIFCDKISSQYKYPKYIYTTFNPPAITITSKVRPRCTNLLFFMLAENNPYEDPVIKFYQSVQNKDTSSGFTNIRDYNAYKNHLEYR
jgi:hypothetical protein